MRRAPLIIIAAFALVLPACGGGDDGDGNGTSTLADSPGAKVFADAGCGNCHTLKAAGTTGTVGPNLDDAQPDAARVEQQVRDGGGAMPAFEDKLSDQEIKDVAEFVAAATRTATGGSSVAAQYEPDDTTLEDCEQSGDSKCYEQAFANIANEEGPKESLRQFDEAIKTPGPIEANCHRIVHAIGAGGLAHFDGDVGKAFVAGSASCTSGYYHGILERSFLGIEEEELGPASRRFCAGPQIRTSEFIAYQCVHGLGHGLMIYTGYDMPLSLKTCDRLATEWDQRSCTGGVFMENLQTSYGTRSRWLKDNDLIYPCNAVAERHKYYCYDLMPSRVLQATGYNWAKTIAHCRRADRNYVDTCFQGMGREASGQTRLDPVRILQICSGARVYANECIHGAAKDMTYTDVGARRAKVLCNTAPNRHRDYCWAGIGSILGSFDAATEKRKAACDGATPSPRFRRACYGGAAIDLNQL
jgi:mono/diheme cytochrome c family protein